MIVTIIITTITSITVTISPQASRPTPRPIREADIRGFQRAVEVPSN